MASNNHVCRACGKQYYACDACDRRLGKSWRTSYCCEEHRDAYQLLVDYVRGGVTKEEAKKALEKYNAMNWTESSSYQTICEIFEANVAEEPAKEEVVEEAPVEEAPIEEAPVAEEAAEEPKAEEKAEEVEEAFVTGTQAVEEKAPVETKTTYAASNGWNKNGWNNNYKGKKRR